MQFNFTIGLILSLGLANAFNLLHTKKPDYIPYYQLCNEAEYAYFNGDMPRCSSLLIHAFELCPPKPKDQYLLAKIYLYYKDVNRMEKLLLASAQNPEYDIPSKYKKDSLLFITMLNPNQYSLIRLNLVRIYENEINNIKYQRIKDTMAAFYNEYREAHVIRDPYHNKEKAQDRMLEIKKKSQQSDSIFLQKLFKYIKVNGYPCTVPNEFHSLIPNYIRLNRKQVDTLLLFNELRAGRMDPFYYGTIKQQLDLYFNEIFCSYYIDPQNCALEDYKLIKRNREAIGMSTYFTESRNCLNCKYQLTPWSKE